MLYLYAISTRYVWGDFNFNAIRVGGFGLVKNGVVDLLIFADMP